MSIARWLLVAAVLACAASAARVGAPAAEGAPSRCRPAPTVPAVTEGESLPGTVARSVGTLRAAMLLVHAADAPPDDSVVPPQTMIDNAAAWYRAISYGRLEFRVETPPRWLPLPAKSAEYAVDAARYLGDAVAAADPYVDFSEIDAVYLAPPLRTPVASPVFASLNGFGVRADDTQIRFWVPFDPGFGLTSDPYLMLHETGHLLGLPDLYRSGVAKTFHRWDVMAARFPAELIAWHRWKLGWLDESQIVCVTGRGKRVVTLTPLERSGGKKAVFVKQGSRILAVEVRARIGHDSTLCKMGVLVTEIDQTQFRRAPVQIHAARSDRGPARGCSAQWNAPFGVGRGDVRTLRLTSWGFRLDVLAKHPNGSYRIRIVNAH